MINTISSFSRVSAGVPSGVINAYAGVTAPDGWLLCDGSSVSRTTYPYLFASFARTFTSATTTSGSTTVSGLSGMVANNVGWGIAGTNIPSGATITSVTNATTVVISAQATATATGVANIAISPYGFTGAANLTTFLLPDLRTRTTMGFSSADTNTSPSLLDALNRVGKVGGSKAEILSGPQIAGHTHPITHGHSAGTTTGGEHSHQVKYVTGAVTGGSADFLRPFPSATPNNVTINDGVGPINSTHSHGVSVSPSTDTSGSNNPTGATAHNNLPNYIVLNYIIKV